MPRNPKVFKRQKKPFPSKKIKLDAVEENSEILEECSRVRTPPRDHQRSPSTSSEGSSSSEKKLHISLQEYDELSCSNKYDIVDLIELGQVLSKIVTCKECGGEICFAITSRVGLASKVTIKCAKCEKRAFYSNSKIVEQVNTAGQIQKAFSINIRLVYAMRCIGKGKAGADLFLGLMNLPPAPTKFQLYTKILNFVVKNAAQDNMLSAVKSAIEENGGSRDLTVAFDGSWQKRGHTSLNGVVTATSCDNDKIIDIEIMSKFCKCPQRLKTNHAEGCKANYSGTSGGMEVEGVKRIYSRSKEVYDVQYTKYLGDGDSKAFIAVSEALPYGPEKKIEKIECVGHIQKRMGTRLRNLKKKIGNKKLSDGKALGGKGRLTESAIDKIQTYYGLAIRRNCMESLHKMRKEVWATYLHLYSTDEFPNHDFCPTGNDSWCKYQKVREDLNISYRHSEHFHLPSAVMTEIKPIFASLSHPDLLSKCLHGKTQNCNESFNNLLWTIIPKRVFVSIQTLKLGAYEAVLIFNRGNISRCDILKSIGIEPGSFCIEALRKIDIGRVKLANRAAAAATKEGRTKRRRAAKKLEDHFEEEEGVTPSYAAGHH